MNKRHDIGGIITSIFDKVSDLVFTSIGGSNNQPIFELQDKYLLAAQKVGLAALLEGLLDISERPTRRGNTSAFSCISKAWAAWHPHAHEGNHGGAALQGANEGSRQIEVTAKTAESLIVYVQPNGNGPDIISFREFSDVVRRQ